MKLTSLFLMSVDSQKIWAYRFCPVPAFYHLQGPGQEEFTEESTFAIFFRNFQELRVMAAIPGVKTTRQVLTQGSGPKPQKGQSVTVNCTGTAMQADGSCKKFWR